VSGVCLSVCQGSCMMGSPHGCVGGLSGWVVASRGYPERLRGWVVWVITTGIRGRAVWLNGYIKGNPPQEYLDGLCGACSIGYTSRDFKAASAKETCVGLCVKWPLLFSSVGIYQQILVKSPVPDFIKIHSVHELLRVDG
jgi:hypothetical protein